MGSREETDGEINLLTLRQWKREGRVRDLAAVAVDTHAAEEWRFFATRYLGSFDHHAATDALLEVLRSDADPGVRSQAAKALEAVGDTRAVPGLIDALRDSDGHVRIGAIRALGTLGDLRAVAALVNSAETTSWPVLREWATDALARLGSPEAVPFLIEYLRPQSEPERMAVRRWGRKLHWPERHAARHLQRIGTREALEPLRSARSRDPLRRWVYNRAIKAIERRSS